MLRAVAALALCLPLAAGAQGVAYKVETVAEGLEYPWSLAFLPDGGLLVTERAGRLRLIAPGGTLMAEPVSGVPVVHASGQAGLFEIALAPDFEHSGTVYLSYACGDAAANNTCLARGHYANGAISKMNVIFEAQPKKRGNAHYGGRIAFLPDGTLVLTLGDGFDYREQAQDTGDHLGTIVRLNPDGSVPADNPFGNEIWSFGHRNVQGIVFDEESGRLIAHEHGPRGGDEINIIERGRNYGWPAATFGVDYNGARISPYDSLPDTEAPVLHWSPSIAPSGMAIYRGDLFPEWNGDLLVSALMGRAVYRVRLSRGRATEEDRMFEQMSERIRDVRVAPDGAVYLLTDSAEGRVLRAIPATRR
ncbi:MAG: PQQ-dependent sugar dehydrogenase [Gammaproteobacteria bacterium]